MACRLSSTRRRSWICFAHQERKLSLRRFLLECLPNGDWRNHSEIQVFIPPGVSHNRQQVLQKVTAGLVVALCGKLFSTYPQHRWLGSEISVSEVGLLEAVHGLASATYEHMIQQWTSTVHQQNSEVLGPQAEEGAGFRAAEEGSGSAANLIEAQHLAQEGTEHRVFQPTRQHHRHQCAHGQWQCRHPD